MNNEEIIPALTTGEDIDKKIAASSFLKEDAWYDIDISGDYLNVSDSYERPQWTLAYNGIPFAPLGGIHALTGQPGHGKTMTFTQLMVAIMRGEYGNLTYQLNESHPQPKVLYIDTEMEKGNTQLVAMRVHRCMGWDINEAHDQFKVIMLRETEKAEDRWRKTLKAIYEVRPTVCFIDGLLDVVADFNENTQCQEIIYKCMKVASHYQMSIWCLVHENPGSTKMVGHLGSMLERKVTDAFGTVKDKNSATGDVTFTVKQKKARAKDLPDWKFFISDDEIKIGIPQQIDAISNNEENTAERMVRDFSFIMEGSRINTRDLRQKVVSILHMNESTATEYINKAVEMNILSVEEVWSKDGSKLRSRHYTFNNGCPF